MNRIQLKNGTALLLLFGVVFAVASECQAWPYSSQSNVFDLSPKRANTYFVAESNIFSLEGRESAFDFSISPTYSSSDGILQVNIYVYDRGIGAVVSSGTGSFRVNQGGQTLASGPLNYASESSLWTSGEISLTATGTLQIVVKVNGHTEATSFLIPKSDPVQLIGWARKDDGTPITGGMVGLYNAQTLLGATDLNNLPEPLVSRTTDFDGSFDFAERSVGQYVLTLQTGNGTTLGSTFWLRNGEGRHTETIVENAGRTDLLNRFLALSNSIEERILGRQTDWMVEVASNVDSDIDATPDLADWGLMIGNIASGTAANFGMAWAAGLSPSHFGSIASGVTVESLKLEGLTTAASIVPEEASSIENQTLTIKGTLAQPYFAYGTSGSEEIEEFDSLFTDDVKRLVDPELTEPFLNVVFSRDNPIHRHPKSWFQALDVYQFAERWLTTYYEEATTEIPPLPDNFSVNRAQSIVDSGEDQLRTIEAGTGQLFIGPEPTEVSSSSAPHEPLQLNLEDYYTKYKVSEKKKDVLNWVKKGSSAVSIGGHAVAAGAAAGIVSAPGAAVAETVAWCASGVSFGANTIQASVKADMTGTYIQMGTKYCANVVTAPLVLKRTQDFIIEETENPYYLNKDKSFGGQVNRVELEGLVIGDKEVFFPVQLNLLPFLPPIRFTSEKQAAIQIENPAGNDTAMFRVETKVRDFSGVHDHVVTPAGELNGDQSGTVYTPFRGHMKANGLLSAGTLETRVWSGPFQISRAKTRNFYVMPINLGVTLPESLSIEEQAEAKMAMRSSLSFVKSEKESMSGEELLAAADRIHSRVDTNLVVGANTFTQDYSFATNIFEATFRLYRPAGVELDFKIEKDGEYIGWDETTSTVHLDFPGECSGNKANPETIVVPNVKGETLTVHMALADMETEEAGVLLEVWEQPVRSAVLAVLPDAINSISRTGVVHTVELDIGESSHQHPLESVTFSTTPLQSEDGTEINWTDVSWSETTNIPAAGIKTCSMDLDTTGIADGTYTGTVAVSSANAGKVTVPVSITIDGQAPSLSVEPIRKWWVNSTGPVVSWRSKDNMTAQSNLVYSCILEPLDGEWSGYHQTTNTDLSSVADGRYQLSIRSRDQALNETENPTDTMIVIDRSGDLWKQRIVDADLNDKITNIVQVSWNGDFDADGAINLMEYYAGTDPTDAGDLFTFAGSSMSPEGNVISWNAKRGITYRVQRTTNLVSGTWKNAPAGSGDQEKSLQTAPADGKLEYRDTSEIKDPVFYKIKTQE